jgi:hypothetical protein
VRIFSNFQEPQVHASSQITLNACKRWLASQIEGETEVFIVEENCSLRLDAEPFFPNQEHRKAIEKKRTIA